MTDHSNAITDFLRRLYLSEQMGLGADFAIGQAKLALYEAAKGCVPVKVENGQAYGSGYNFCRDQVLTNLSLLFGISKEGDKK